MVLVCFINTSSHLLLACFGFSLFFALFLSGKNIRKRPASLPWLLLEVHRLGFPKSSVPRRACFAAGRDGLDQSNKWKRNKVSSKQKKVFPTTYKLGKNIFDWFVYTLFGYFSHGIPLKHVVAMSVWDSFAF